MGSHVCPWWLAYTFDNPIRRLFHRPHRIFAPYVRQGMTAADIGCGLGFFAIGLARLVRPGGKVTAVDVQQQMLQRAEKRAAKSGMAESIEFRQCTTRDIRVTGPLDFALAFWMVHESPDIPLLFRQLHAALKPSGLLFVAEPKFHVSPSLFRREIDAARQAGLVKLDEPDVRFSFTSVFEKKNAPS